MSDESAYAPLAKVLTLAYERASQGKGKARHATEDNFINQPVCTELRKLGVAPALFQIRKKALEVARLTPDKAQDELLDIIVYAAAAWIFLHDLSGS
jgi:hypothetical protein